MFFFEIPLQILGISLGIISYVIKYIYCAYSFVGGINGVLYKENNKAVVR